VLSAMGVQVCPVPTAILSTHSGGFGNMTFCDLTAYMEDYAAHWKGLGIAFDAIYSGFLASARQIELVARFIDDFGGGTDQLVVVDPVMADDGKLYRTYTPDMQQKMKMLVGKAGIITPNVTEACFLFDESYSDRPMAAREIRQLLKRLSDLGPDTVVITSVKTDDGRHANAGFSRRDGAYWKVPFERIAKYYPGTGDIFTSVLLGSLLSGDNLAASMDRATIFLSHAVRVTHESKTAEREGVLLERVLPFLGSSCKDISYEALE